MKHLLRFIFCLGIFAVATNKSAAQCDLQFNNFTRQVVGTPVTLPGGKCQYTVNVSFNIITNSGFKYLFFHTWIAEDYPDPPIFDCSNGNTPARDPGTALQLGTARDEPGKSIADLGFIGLKEILDTVSDGVEVDVTSAIATTFPHDPSVELTQPSNSPGLTATVTKSGDTLHFDIRNYQIIVNRPCGTQFAVYSDIWGSNSNANDPKAQCYICRLGFGNLTVTGLQNCNFPRQYQISITTTETEVDEVTYSVYIDLDNDGIIDFGEPLAYTSAPINISATQPYFSGLVSLPAPYSTEQPYITRRYIIRVDYVPPTSKGSRVIALLNPGCIPLPVTIASFNAKRTNRSNVAVTWETKTEQNCSGFNLERNINGTWEILEFIPSKAAGGNSNSPITYSLNDVNSAKGISQYRIRQIDFDGAAKLSQIRAVRGEGQKGTTIVYPNPSSDGTVNVVFEGGIAKRNVTIQDVSGRIVKQWNNYTNNNIQVTNLQPGFYTIRIVDAETGEQNVEKVIVNNR
jgi:hypothetical protein